MSSRSAIVLSLLVGLLGGCAVDLGAGVGAGEGTLERAPSVIVSRTVARSAWTAAPAGCEDVRGALAGCENEPGLGALLAADGRVLCVDAIELLSLDLGDPLAGDPSPQPNLPMINGSIAEP